MTADIVAKNNFLIMKSFRHSYECSLCLTECSYFSNRSVYSSTKDCVFRTRNSIVNDVNNISSVGSLLNTNLTSKTIEFIESVLFKWHDNRTQVISKNHYSKIKSHDMTHLAYVAKYHGPINCFNIFARKASLHNLHSLFSSLPMENILTQIMKRLDDKWLIIEKPKFSISDIQNTICLFYLRGKIINRMTSNLENDVIDQDCYIYVKEENQEYFKPYIIEYIAIDNINNVFFITREVLTSGSIEKYIVHSNLEITNLIKQTNFFKNYFEGESIGKNLKIFDARLVKLSFIKGVCIKAMEKSFICPLNSYEHN
uniref:LEF-7 n=1 Tax=Strongyloides venezuelensis TaxID=75913 RepID=A0A0K0FPR2_STRVS